MDENEFDYDYDVEYTNSDLEKSEYTIVAPESYSQPEKYLQTLEIEDVEYRDNSIEEDHYLNMKSNKANVDFQTTSATPVAPSVQNLSAPTSTWKKPVLIGAACLAALWWYNQD